MNASETVRARLRVRYAETDQMGVVYHGNYLPWMEVGRVEWCRANGVVYREMEAGDGILLAVAEVNCRYHAPARYDDEVEVETRVLKAHPRLIHFGYEMRNAATGERLANGETKHIFVNRAMKPARLPEKYYAMFGIKS